MSAVDPVENAAARFAALSAAFDPNTRRHLLARGLAPGWRCLEVGGGGGSIASWLAGYVGPAGRVRVTDTDTRFLEGLRCERIEISRHDIVSDPLPSDRFDLVHTRMVLIHLAERDRVLDRLAAALRPGGWLVCEEIDGSTAARSAGESGLKTHEAMVRLNRDRGVDDTYGRSLFGRFRALGLSACGAESFGAIVVAGSPLAYLLQASYEIRRDAMIQAGYLTRAEYDVDLSAMSSAAFAMLSPTMWTVWGRRPEG